MKEREKEFERKRERDMGVMQRNKQNLKAEIKRLKSEERKSAESFSQVLLLNLRHVYILKCAHG